MRAENTVKPRSRSSSYLPPEPDLPLVLRPESGPCSDNLHQLEQDCSEQEHEEPVSQGQHHGGPGTKSKLGSEQSQSFRKQPADAAIRGGPGAVCPVRRLSCDSQCTFSIPVSGRGAVAARRLARPCWRPAPRGRSGTPIGRSAPGGGCHLPDRPGGAGLPAPPVLASSYIRPSKRSLRPATICCSSCSGKPSRL